MRTVFATTPFNKQLSAAVASAPSTRLDGLGRASQFGRVHMALTGLRILVIEDVDDLLDMVVMLLRIEGAEVVGARNGSEALELFCSRDFGVVVCDLGLPDISGNAMIRAIIGAARRPVKVIVISGESQQSLTRALEAGAAVAFAKPCEWADVVGYLQDLRGSTAA